MFTTKLIFKGSQHGFTAQIFHELCDNMGPTLTVVQSEQGKIFGGFTSIPWSSPDVDKEHTDLSAFVFSQDNGTIMPVKPATKVAVEHSKKWAACFGWDIWLRENLRGTGNLSKLGESYTLPPGVLFNKDEGGNTYMAGSYHFIVKEIEVYSISFS